MGCSYDDECEKLARHLAVPEGEPCNAPAEDLADLENPPAYCVIDHCEWCGDEPLCPHPRACDRRGKCLHPKYAASKP
jgi:hypothetical protein